ncbi:nuclear transport factor 2 family protein [Nocardioides abyssi]|uniref:Nuclear transport factor 2 family protein n=1 Tax=Nocardioides abyssi TaxID=3058370 RepID=A0ABT8EP01_9ACTN|nr:nuclear transport factor 2 family protein [Nocardioides abyssi]MDN4159878.1 nuclear transport factor 2 family protein [Nocardioides abyssi]
MLDDPHQVVVRALDALAADLADGDVVAAAEHFVAWGSIWGDELREEALGSAEVAAYLTHVVRGPHTLRWDVEQSWACRRASQVWFVADADVVLRPRGTDGPSERRAARVSGVLVADGGRWRFELFAGFQAAVLPPLRLVGVSP